ncbi:MAG: hypothetical protein MUC91_05140 [Verrucomicrobia bacterium]|nr:hypothetical protein [Verrucomicrobiota bacterium]
MSSAGSSVSWRSAVGFPGILGTVAFFLYVGWNVRWLVQGRIPPREGNGSIAFLWNPFTLPFCALLIFTAGEIAWKRARRRRLVLSHTLALAWPVLLLAAWITKLAMGPRWW